MKHLKKWKLYHFHDTSENARVRQTCDLEDNRFLHPDARNLAAFLYRLEKKHPEHFENIRDAVRMAAPFFDRFSLEPSQLNQERIRLEWKEKGSDDYFNAAMLSDGTLRFMCLAALLLQPVLPPVIILDEPELGLHPYGISVLAGLLQAASQCAQVMVATQSVTLVNQFGPGDIIVVDRDKRESLFRRPGRSDLETWLDDYGMGDLWEKNVLGGRP
ncbi:MAG: AAA family ATPase [Desulfobacteraceae bacterium]|nr:AAA family ATPase [Desulfobacteraceae bacterium]